MKLFKKSSELLWLLGTIFVALGVAICSKANLGVSMIAAPAFVISEAIPKSLSFFSVGVTEYIIQGLLLVILCIAIKKFNWRYLLAFAVAIIYGYTLNFFLWVFDGVVLNAVWLRWIMLVLGDLCTAFGVACFFRTYMPLQVYELFVAEFTSRYKLNLNTVKWCFDIALLIVSLVLALTLFGDIGDFDWSTIGYNSFHSIGLGTLFTTAFNSPFIRLGGVVVDKIFDPAPRFPKLKAFLKPEQ